MIPNIHNEEVFDSEFDLDTSPLLFSDPSQKIRFYKVTRNSDLLEYSLAILEIKDSNYYNNFLQNALNIMPLTKSNPSYLELHTLYAWEGGGSAARSRSMKIAVLMEKFDNMLISVNFSGEKEAFDILGKTLKASQNVGNLSSLNLKSICLKNKTVKIIELGYNNSEFLLLDSSQTHHTFLKQISEFFESKMASFSTQNKLRTLLNSFKVPQASISGILEEHYEENLITRTSSSNEDAFPYAPICKEHKKKTVFICKQIQCHNLLCDDCMKSHKKAHYPQIIEYKEFLKSEITQGGSLRMFEVLITKIPEMSTLIEKKYIKAQQDITNLFSFLESQILKIISNAKKNMTEYLNSSHSEDNERLLIVEKQLLFHKRELQKLQETNEVRAPYLPEDLQKTLPFLGEVLYNFQPRFIEKIKSLRLESLSTDEPLRKLQHSFDMKEILRHFSEIVREVCIIDPVLHDLEIEKLQTTFLEIKPTILSSPPRAIPVESLLFLETNRFLASYSLNNKDFLKGSILRFWDTASLSESFEKKKLLFGRKNKYYPKRVYDGRVFGLVYMEEDSVNLFKGRRDCVGVWNYNDNLLNEENSFGLETLKGGENQNKKKVNEIQSKKLKEGENQQPIEETPTFQTIHLNDEAPIFCLEIFHDEKLLFLGSEHDRIEIFSLSTLKSINNVLLPPSDEKNINGDILVLCKPELHKYLISGNSLGIFRLWDLTSNMILTTFHLKRNEIPTTLVSLFPLSITPSEIQIRTVIGTNKGSLQVWDAGKGILLRDLETSHYESVTSLLISNNLQILISSSLDSGVILWDLEKFYVKRLVIIMNEIPLIKASSLCWANHSDLLACGTADGRLLLLDIGWELRQLEEIPNRNRQRSFFSKQSSDLTDFLMNNEEEKSFSMNFPGQLLIIPNESNDKTKKRKASVMEVQKNSEGKVVKYIDDSLFEITKAKIWLKQEKRKTSICRLF